ncbi:hydroquinone glucosyltransferase-like [Rosa rugosa]|uniref:hydroquinone glucosyltransferase-like n=1 Tax=Rosa rugosa TaxID=74645 RepID=UPI002B4043FA|nr:hydroquinone glucosyltransferase-like [Rosa rugosa]
MKPPHVAIVPSPGIGHLIPLVELAKRLVVHHHFSVTFFIPSDDGSNLTPHRKVLDVLPQSISSTFLPPANFDDLPKDIKHLTRIALTMTRSLPALRDSIKALAESTRLVALVVDLFGGDAFDVAKEFDILPYILYPTNAMVLWFQFELPKLDQTISCEYRDLPEPVKLPGCVPIYGKNLLDSVQDRTNQAYKVLIDVSKRYKSAAGIMINSFVDLQPGAFKAFKEQGQGLGLPPIYPVGPITETGSTNENACLSWLDMQPNGSVLFISFGSGGTISSEQMNELALGLEKSRVRFIWNFKCPNETSKNAAYFGVQSSTEPLSFLPQGFLERTKDVGLVVTSWAPQVPILSHGSTGGFLTHCGWNSTLESIVHGVPLVAWPLYAEQRMNAVLLAQDLTVAWRVKMNDKGIVESQDIAKYAKGLIEGEEGKVLRKRMIELKEASQMALSQNGSSTKSLGEVAQIWKDHKN